MKGMHEPREIRFVEGNKWESERKEGEKVHKIEYKIEGVDSADGVLSGSGSDGVENPWKIDGKISGNKVGFDLIFHDGQVFLSSLPFPPFPPLFFFRKTV